MKIQPEQTKTAWEHLNQLKERTVNLTCSVLTEADSLHPWGLTNLLNTFSASRCVSLLLLPSFMLCTHWVLGLPIRQDDCQSAFVNVSSNKAQNKNYSLTFMNDCFVFQQMEWYMNYMNYSISQKEWFASDKNTENKSNV